MNYSEQALHNPGCCRFCRYRLVVRAIRKNISGYLRLVLVPSISRLFALAESLFHQCFYAHQPVTVICMVLYGLLYGGGQFGVCYDDSYPLFQIFQVQAGKSVIQKTNDLFKAVQ